jgi:DNA-binding NarL/FixJ family response regulator
MQVFIVEDSPPVRARLADMLQALPGIEIVGQAGQAQAAIRDILAVRPDVVLLDLNLGQESGFEVLRAVCPQEPGIDFYMLSNFAADPYRQLAARLGARDFFDKSKQMEGLRDMLAQRAAVHS